MRSVPWGRIALGAPFLAVLLIGLAIDAMVQASSAARGWGKTQPLVSNPAGMTDLEHLRSTGDLDGQRAHLWAVFASLIRSDRASPAPAFMRWFDAAEAFGPNEPAVNGTRSSFPLKVRRLPTSGSTAPPLITFIHFDAQAYRHIRRERLFAKERLDAISRHGMPDGSIAGMRTVPRFAPDTVLAMTAWWPVAATGITAMPVWDGGGQTNAAGGNSYVNWRRAVAIVPGLASSATPVRAEFAGRSFPQARRIGLDRLYHVRLNAGGARRLMADPDAEDAAAIALGRPLRSGDYLALVGMHIMTAELQAGVWGTFWWHDRPDEGRFAQGRPPGLAGVWRNYLMDVAFDAVLPRESDGSPHICFNPWFDAQLPDGRDGKGVTSNCVNCHARASYPRTDFLPVRRGAPDIAADPAFAPGRLRTGLLWSIANAGAEPHE